MGLLVVNVIINDCCRRKVVKETKTEKNNRLFCHVLPLVAFQLEGWVSGPLGPLLATLMLCIAKHVTTALQNKRLTHKQIVQQIFFNVHTFDALRKSLFSFVKRYRASTNLWINALMNSDVFYELKYFHMYCNTVYEGGTSYDLVKNHLLSNVV